jgi:hypothetical protein
MSVKCSPIEEVFVGMRVNKETLQAIDKTKIDIAMKKLVVIWHPEITVRFLQAPDSIIAHTIIHRENNLYGIPPPLKFTTQTLNNVCQPPDFGNRCALRSNHHYIHAVKSPTVQGTGWLIRDPARHTDSNNIRIIN